MSNIEPKNADGVGEILQIGSALKRARSFMEDTGDEHDLRIIDESILIIEEIIDEGAKLMRDGL